MKKIKNMMKSFVAIPFMKYILVLVVSVVLIGFVGSNSIRAHFKYKMRIADLEEEIKHYEGEYKRDQKQIHELQSNPKAMERIARERYFMKHDDEDIFVLNDEDYQQQQMEESHEAAQ